MNLRLLPMIVIGDFDAVRQQVAWLNDPEVVRYSEQRHKHHTVASQLDYLATMGKPNIYRTINVGEKMIGTISALVDKSNKIADLGLLIGEKEYWGKGYGLKAWQIMIELVFLGDVRKIEAGCMATNVAMSRICESSGMYLEGKRFGHFLIGDREVAMELWGMYR